MGKSDPYVFNEYRLALSGISMPASVAFLGFVGENSFTMSLPSKVRDFYDLSLNNWNINSPWCLDKKYDLIVCTRCAYFAKDPYDFIERCRQSLNPGGQSLVDWGLGDHWRFSEFKVGWVKNDEHEYAYGIQNKLYSCFWREGLEDDPEVQEFWYHVVNKKGYDPSSDIVQTVKKEVPKIIDYPTKYLKTKFLWPEEPQLYIVTRFGR